MQENEQINLQFSKRSLFLFVVLLSNKINAGIFLRFVRFFAKCVNRFLNHCLTHLTVKVCLTPPHILVVELNNIVKAL